MSNAVVRELYACIGAGDIEKALSLLADDIVWRLHGPATVPYFGTFNGPAEVGEFFKALDTAEQIDEFIPTEFIDGSDGKHVFVRGHERCTARRTGRTFSANWLHVFQVADGKIKLFEEFIDSAAVAAAYA